MEGFSVKIFETSKELTAKEKIKLKDTSNAIRIDEVTQDGKLVISPDFYVVLDVHNEKSDNVDYKNYIVVDKKGNKYVTGSESFFTSFRDIYEDMQGEDEEYEIEIYRLESKNYKGKTFITCSIV